MQLVCHVQPTLEVIVMKELLILVLGVIVACLGLSSTQTVGLSIVDAEVERARAKGEQEVAEVIELQKQYLAEQEKQHSKKSAK